MNWAIGLCENKDFFFISLNGARNEGKFVWHGYFGGEVEQNETQG